MKNELFSHPWKIITWADSRCNIIRSIKRVVISCEIRDRTNGTSCLSPRINDWMGFVARGWIDGWMDGWKFWLGTLTYCNDSLNYSIWLFVRENSGHVKERRTLLKCVCYLYIKYGLVTLCVLTNCCRIILPPNKSSSFENDLVATYKIELTRNLIVKI